MKHLSVKNWKEERGSLRDTCLTGQDATKATLDYFGIGYGVIFCLPTLSKNHQSKVWCSFGETLNFLSELLAEPGIHQPAYFQRKLYPNG